MTLLRNRGGALPLRSDEKLLVVGPYISYGVSPGTLGAAITRRNAGRTEVIKGSEINGDDTTGFAAAIEAAKTADAVVLALGTDGSLEHESMDRLDTRLPKIQSQLALAVLQAALFGDVNPSGKLPYTIYPNNYTDTSDFLDMSLASGEGRGYRYYCGKPLFPFGWGLSYTSFELRPAGRGADLTILADIRNVGLRPGTETVQLYFIPPTVATPVGLVRAPVPPRRLLQFRKVALTEGTSTVLPFDVDREQLWLVDDAGHRRVLRGVAVTTSISNGVDQGFEVTMQL